MPYYYFHVREGSTLNRDEEGQDLPNADSARREAINANREILGEKLLHGGSLDRSRSPTRLAMSWMWSTLGTCCSGAASFAPIPTMSPSRRP